MDTYDLTLRFDDSDHALTAKDGLSIEQVAKLLTSLSQAIDVTQEHKVVLSEVRGNCYALELSTGSITAHETLKVIHKKISQNDFRGLTYHEKQYSSTLKSILGNNYTLDVYDKDKSFRVRVEKIETPNTPPFYYETTSIYGIITSIGGIAIDGVSYINISQQNFQVKVTSAQEKELVKYFKTNKIRFSISKKIRFENDVVVSAELNDFEVIQDRSFADAVGDFRNQSTVNYFLNIDDSVEAVRNLRE